jgi:N-methylhydantoinase A/oxoprolinase/acetone carboxylase beta subunit
MRGAGLLSGLDQAVVVDVGGTTTDVGALRRGFPRESGGAVEVGGVRTNLRMPDLLSLGLGGGSLVVAGDEIAVGPRSVGYRLTERALVFGGDTLTATDVAVAAGRLVLGDPDRVSALDPELVSGALDLIHRRVEQAVDRMRTSAEPLPVILVGGGADLLAREIAGASEVVRPPHAAIANAIGAAIANVGGEVDRVYSYEEHGRDRTLTLAVEEAVRRARQAGADPESVEVVAIEEVPLAYLPGQAVRVRVKAVGTLGHPALATAAVPATRGAE